MFLQGKICVSARVGNVYCTNLASLCSLISILVENISPVIFDPDYSFQRQNAICLTKKLFIKVSTVCRSRLLIFYFKEKFCFACVGKSLARCLFPKRSEDLVEKIISPVIFVTNCSFKQ